MAIYNHQNNFATNQTSNTTAGATTTPLNSIPTIDAPYYIALDATNINAKYEVVLVTSDTATNINHAATTYAHTTAEEVRLVIPATEMDSLWDASATGWFPVPTGVTLTYSSADDPTYVVTTSSDIRSYVQVGDRVKFTNNSTTFYGIVTVTAAGSLTLYGGTDYDVANSAITAVYFSHMKSPLGFPLDPTKWTAETENQSEVVQSTPTQSTWYNLGTLSLTIPIGSWDVYYNASVTGNDNSSTVVTFTTLSTANNSESDADFTSGSGFQITGATNVRNKVQQTRRKHLTLASKTVYYLNHMTETSGATSILLNETYNSRTDKTIIRAVCAYL